MPTRIPSDQIRNLQQIEAVVAGPADANRLFIIYGKVVAPLGVFSRGESQQRIEVFSVLVGPTFTRQQFIQANATASFASIALSSSEQGVAQWQILDVDADWDDESGQVELRIEAQVICTGSPQGQNVNIFGFNFAVTILASVPAT